MTGKLFLTGGGDEKQSFEIDKIFLKNIKSVLYIPIAWKNENYEGCLKWFKESMLKHKKIRINMLTNLYRRVTLSNYDAVYIGGGNTYKLLKKIKDSHFDKKLIRYYQNGGTVYGGSAGAIIWGKDVSSASRGVDSDKNNVGLEDITGLNILNGKNIQCHFKDNQTNKEIRYARYTKTSIFAVPEESGLLIKGNKIKVLGTKPVTLITSKKIIKYLPNKMIEEQE